MADPVAVWSGELTLSGVTLHVHVLDNGMRVIDAADFEALFEAWENGGAVPLEAEIQAFARWQRGLPLEDGQG